eukprot:TRINITY_DN12877_c0_g1_i1.p1 TRINITY_DN12877_c0_g1~~TRINITY_DN12877_c0_g1_i1.p1  ORF type:complete len:258 (-),score=85.98 TRINITY_DN12877_c0_g1_i1:16-789(-)
MMNHLNTAHHQPVLSTSSFLTLDQLYSDAINITRDLNNQFTSLDLHQSNPNLNKKNYKGVEWRSEMIQTMYLKVELFREKISMLQSLLDANVDVGGGASMTGVRQTKKHKWTIRIGQLSDQYRTLVASITRLDNQNRAEMLELDQRRQLLNQSKEECAIVIEDMKRLEKEGESLESSEKMSTDLIAMGHSVISALVEQRQTIKSIRRKVEDVAMALGVTRGMLRKIENHILLDKVILYGGMLVTLVIFLVLVYYYRW